jgi:nucleotide-binding universal stress UspA family protein
MRDASDRQGVARCLVLGYDGTDSSRHAASWAVNALLPDGKLVLVYADRPLNAPPSPLTNARERAQVGHAVVDELLLDGEDSLLDVDLVTEVSDADPLTALIESAERHGADAIVVGSEPHSRLHRALGVLTDQLLERLPVAVIAVPAGAPIRRRESAAAARRPGSRRARSE